MKKVLLLFLFGACLPGIFHAQYRTHAFKANLKNGERIYRSACVSCHGGDGRGTDKIISGFEKPATFPDFTKCNQTTPEYDAGYQAVIERGGPVRGFSEIMPAFHEALSSKEIDDVVAYVRHFCRNPHWPRAELNLPLPLVTEKAYPENEVVVKTAVNVEGAPGWENTVTYEQRFGVKNQIEVAVPFHFEDQTHTWYGGVGDTTLALKRVLFSNLNSGSILSVLGGFVVPTGNRTRGFGSGTTSFETFAAYGQLFRTDTFIQTQFGAELPFRTSVAPQSLFFNTALGQSFAADRGRGRMWSPMFEFAASRDLEDGAKTDWDVVPEIQVTISQRQHVRGNVGFLFPVTNTAGRSKQLVFYLLWDRADGKLTEGW
jgi:cytochrome c553